MEIIEIETKRIMEQGIPEGQMIWYTPVICPPNKKQSKDNQSIVELMLSALFQHKFPSLDPRFFIFWDTLNKGYKIAIYSISGQRTIGQEDRSLTNTQALDLPGLPDLLEDEPSSCSEI